MFFFFILLPRTQALVLDAHQCIQNLSSFAPQQHHCVDECVSSLHRTSRLCPDSHFKLPRSSTSKVNSHLATRSGTCYRDPDTLVWTFIETMKKVKIGSGKSSAVIFGKHSQGYCWYLFYFNKEVKPWNWSFKHETFWAMFFFFFQRYSGAAHRTKKEKEKILCRLCLNSLPTSCFLSVTTYCATLSVIDFFFPSHAVSLLKAFFHSLRSVSVDLVPQTSASRCLAEKPLVIKSSFLSVPVALTLPLPFFF